MRGNLKLDGFTVYQQLLLTHYDDHPHQGFHDLDPPEES